MNAAHKGGAERAQKHVVLRPFRGGRTGAAASGVPTLIFALRLEAQPSLRYARQPSSPLSARCTLNSLQAFCRLVAFDSVDAGAVLRTQLRHARNLAGYLRARSSRVDGPGDAHERALSVLESQAAVVAAKLDAVVAATDPLAPFSFEEFLNARSEVMLIEREVLGNAWQVLRSLRQLTYVQSAGEYPAPSLFFGLEQAKIAERLDGVAHSYHTALRELVGGVLEAPVPPSSMTLTYEYMAFSHHTHTEARRTIGIECYNQVSVPAWLLYLPRYLPMVCHELAHPLAASLQREGFREPFLRFEEACTEVVDRHLGEGARQIQPNMVPSIAREIITDSLALAAAGPAYVYAWYATTLGSRRVGPDQQLVLPTWVRMSLLAAQLSHHPEGGLRGVPQRANEEYRQIMEQRGFAAKCAYHDALLLACQDFADAIGPKLRDASIRLSSQPDPNWGAEVRAIGDSIGRLPEHAGFNVDALDCDASWQGGPLLSAPALLWDLQLSLAAARTTGGTPPPEGRIFHRLHRPNRSVEWEEGEYSEWLWVKLHPASSQESLRAAWGGAATVRAAVGAHNAVAIRGSFVARRFSDYPPTSSGIALHASRQILVQLVRNSQDRRAFSDALACGRPLLVSEVSIRRPEGGAEFAVIGSVQHRDDFVAVFRSLGAGDLVVVSALAHISDARGVIDAFRTCDAVVRTSSTVLVPTDDAWAAAATADSRGADVRCFMRLERGAALGPLRDRLTALGARSVERVLGLDDLEAVFPVRGADDLRRIVDIPDVLQGAGIVSFDARIGFGEET